MLKQRSCDTQIENYPFRSEIELNIDFDTGNSPALNSNVLTKFGLKILKLILLCELTSMYLLLNPVMRFQYQEIR